MIECRQRHKKLKTHDKTQENRTKRQRKNEFLKEMCGGLFEKVMD